MVFRFVHTADWQLGKGFANIPGDADAALRDQRIETVRAVARLATERDVDAVLVAGDAFDANAVAHRTLIRMLDGLEEFAGDWVFIPGNHDPALADSVWTRLQERRPPNVHLALQPEQPLLLADGRAVVLPAVLQRKHEIGDLTAWFDHGETPEGAIRIGLAHGSVPECLPDPSEAVNPVAAGRADAARLDYLALGDWHGTLRINDRTWYAGTPETDSFSSSNPGNVLVVTIGKPGAPVEVEPVPIGRFLWHSKAAEIRCAEDMDALHRRISELAPEPDRCLLRLTLSGAVDLATRARLHRCLEDWRALLRHLDVQDHLLDEPSDDDLDRIDRGGFVRTAVERLRSCARNNADPERDVAMMALRRLYETHVGAGG
ncbi:MAG: DNA repair exonuclease [Cyanobacteria bacterium MAG CAR1_bin_15]|nr:DNA repair exonuclease [Cyanobacteria bacterium MAG CAR1_bin_15]